MGGFNFNHRRKENFNHDCQISHHPNGLLRVFLHLPSSNFPQFPQTIRTKPLTPHFCSGPFPTQALSTACPRTKASTTRSMDSFQVSSDASSIAGFFQLGLSSTLRPSTLDSRVQTICPFIPRKLVEKNSVKENQGDGG